MESIETFQDGVGECRSRDHFDRFSQPAGFLFALVSNDQIYIVQIITTNTKELYHTKCVHFRKTQIHDLFPRISYFFSCQFH